MTINWSDMRFLIRNKFSWALIIVIVAAFITLFFSVQAGIFALIFAVIGWWVWENPEEGFIFFIVLAPLLPMLKITQTIGTFSLIKDVIIITLFAKVFLIPLLQKKLVYRHNIIVAPLIALVIWSVIASLRSDAMILGTLRLRDIVLYILLYFAVLFLDHNKEILRQRFKWFGFSVMAVLVLGVWQWFFSVDSAVLRFDPAREIWIPRLSSVLAHPSIFGQYVVAAANLFLSVAMFVTNKKVRLASTVLFVVTLPFIFLTYSRAVWIGFVFSIGAIALLFILRLITNKVSKKTLSKYVVGFGITLIIAVALLIRFSPAGPFIRSIFDPTYASNEERLTFFVRLVAPVSNSEAIIGSGLGDVTEQNFREIDLQAYDIAVGDARGVQLTKNRTLVDNQYLKTFIEMGVIGLVLYGWIYYRLAQTAIRSSLLSTDYSLLTVLGFWQIGFLSAFIIQAFFIDIWDIFPTNAMFWIIAALASQPLANNCQKESASA